MDTQSLSDDEENRVNETNNPDLSDDEAELDNDFTLVDLNSSGEEQTEITADDLSGDELQPRHNTNKHLSILGLHTADETGVLNSEHLWDFSTKESDNLFQIEQNISSDEEDISGNPLVYGKENSTSNSDPNIEINDTQHKDCDPITCSTIDTSTCTTNITISGGKITPQIPISSLQTPVSSQPSLSNSPSISSHQTHIIYNGHTYTTASSTPVGMQKIIANTASMTPMSTSLLQTPQILHRQTSSTSNTTHTQYNKYKVFKTGESLATVIIKPINPKGSEQVSESPNTQSIGCVMINKSKPNKNVPTVPVVIQPPTIQPKPTTTPQLVYVNPPPHAKIIYPGHTSLPRQILLPANTVQGQTRPMMVSTAQLTTQRNIRQMAQTVGGSQIRPVYIPHNTFFKPMQPASGLQTVPIQTSSPQILMPTSAANNNQVILIPASGAQPQTKIVSSTNVIPQNLITQTMVRSPLIQSPSLQPKPGQIVLQTVDGQKLLLQPIHSERTVDNPLVTNKLVFQQGKLNPVTGTTQLQIDSSANTLQIPSVVAYSNAAIPSKLTTGSVQACMTGSNPTLMPVGNSKKTTAINKDMLTFVPASIPTSNSNCRKTTYMNLKINVENAQGEVKHTINKRLELDTESLLKKKSVLLDILSTPASKAHDNRTVIDDIDKNIEVLEINQNARLVKEAVHWAEKYADGNKLSKRQIFTKKKNEQHPKPKAAIGINGMTYFKKAVKDTDDVACSVPLQVCGQETLEHLISLTQKKPEKTKPVVINDSLVKIVSVPDVPRQPCVSSLLRNAFRQEYTANNANRRKQVLTNRRTEPEETILLAPNEKTKRRSTPVKNTVKKPVEHHIIEYDSDEVISSINDSDLENEYFFQEISVVNNDSDTLISEDVYEYKVKLEPIDSSDNAPFSPQISNICSLNIDHEGKDGDLKRKREHGDTLNQKRSKAEYFHVYNNPNHQNIHLDSDSSQVKQKHFIPLTNFLQNSGDVPMKSGNLDVYSLVPQTNPHAPFDYSKLTGPVGVTLGGELKKVKAFMRLKECFVKCVPDFRIIESRFSINGRRNVYSCHLCKGEYATINLNSMGDHLEMHRKFPKIHRLVQERPYEVTALTGNEVSEMVAAINNIDEYNTSFITRTSKSSNRKRHRCTLCPYAARSATDLQSHMNVHTMSSRVTCEICGIVYRNYKVVEVHKTTAHKSDLKKTVYVSARPL